MIRTKADMVRLLRSGAFGNRLKSWTFPEYMEAILTDPTVEDGTASLRYIGTPGVVLPRYARQGCRDLCLLTGYRWAGSLGCDPERILVTEAPPDDRLLIQGEIVRGVRGLEFRYSTTPNIALRHAMADAKIATGLAAKMLLERHLTPSSLEDLYAVMDRWPDHVVELSAWACEVGDIPGRNAIVWEVRSY